MIYKRLMTHKIFTTYKKALGSLAICLLLMMVVTSCSSDKPTYLEPHLSTLAASDITRTEATLNGIVSIEGKCLTGIAPTAQPPGWHYLLLYVARLQWKNHPYKQCGEFHHPAQREANPWRSSNTEPWTDERRCRL